MWSKIEKELICAKIYYPMKHLKVISKITFGLITPKDAVYSSSTFLFDFRFLKTRTCYLSPTCESFVHSEICKGAKMACVFSHKWKCKPIITSSAVGLCYLSTNASLKDFLTGLHNTSDGFITIQNGSEYTWREMYSEFWYMRTTIQKNYS